ncbi:hypothetical protein AB0N17_02825 [Streptomyces sp. NPDC051133]|uniref:hypothetical protein n=1 Tax=Streptomyces sp. NPDC051133 TaxID=3155521 RepID=UPI00343C6691
MPPSATSSDSVRSAAEVNKEIRGLMLRAGGHLKPQDRPTYQRLVAEWAESMRAEVVTAA